MHATQPRSLLEPPLVLCCIEVANDQDSLASDSGDLSTQLHDLLFFKFEIRKAW